VLENINFLFDFVASENARKPRNKCVTKQADASFFPFAFRAPPIAMNAAAIFASPLDQHTGDKGRVAKQVAQNDDFEPVLVACQFVQEYYKYLQNSTSKVYKFYADASQITFGPDGEPFATVQGLDVRYAFPTHARRSAKLFPSVKSTT
jgi:hypothetical protein